MLPYSFKKWNINPQFGISYIGDSVLHKSNDFISFLEKRELK